TGIHVLDPQVLSFIPNGTFCNIIDAYCEMIHQGLKIKGFIARNHYWHDIGTVTGYQAATRDALVRQAFGSVIPELGSDSLVWSKLKGDGSDRTWYRVSTTPTEDNGIPAKGIGGRREAVSITSSGKPLLDQSSVILVDHGPPSEDSMCEADAFAAIGRHLHHKGIPVPRIFAYDRPSGLVVLEDLGNLHLQRVIRRAANTEEVVSHYRAIIDLLILMGIEGAKGFDPAYTYQTPYYDLDLILERESRYFVEAFVNGYKGLEIRFDELKEEFEVLARRALGSRYTGFLHRDFQSRNILVRNRNYYLIDFQGGRLGPLQYDLASLLIDPYAELPRALQLRLLNYYLKRLSDFTAVDADEFLDAYVYCAMNRNLQILGAFGFLTRVKGKKDFETYIPPAVSSLKARLRTIEQGQCPKLSSIIERI
ncbi:MAG: phosphotransferase, partial [Desulfobacterales bacterium]|nr:phosphotransferase [Desulfobacterales bacterium]